MTPDDLTFKRNELATFYCDNLEGKTIGNARSGLFLAAPRRVGKSTFLLEDLIPEAQLRGWVTVYVDLWLDKKVDPFLLITEAIKQSIIAHKGNLSKLAKKIQLQKISILKTIELDFSKPGMPENVTLTDLLKDLIELSGKSVLLIIDEAQHALTTPDGINAMFALKSARDQLNLSHRSQKLMLVLTGSNRDKLAQLVIKKDQPFFGSDITPFPLLDKHYADFFTERANRSLVTNNKFDKNSVWEAFQLVGHRPEILSKIMGATILRNEAQSFSKLLHEDAFIWQNQIWREFENAFNHLTPLQRTILTLLIEQHRAWSPFSEESMQYYKKMTHQDNLSVSSVQAAIQSLRDQELIWQSHRGGYALEDQSFEAWFKHKMAQKNL